MKIIYRFFILVLMLGIAATVGCRTEDKTPVYQYYGGQIGQEGNTEGQGTGTDTNLVSEEDVRKINYHMIFTDCVLAAGLKGFLTSETDIDNFWQRNCQGYDLPDVDSSKQIIAYYSAKIGGCEDMKINEVGLSESSTVVALEKILPPPDCTCTKAPKYWRIFLALDQVEDMPPRFIIHAGEKPCPAAE